MSDIPTNLKYRDSHEWASAPADNIITVGITDHAQEQLGDLVFVELPEVGTQLDAGGEAAVVESVKAASDIYSPVSGEVVDVNEALGDSPEIINEDPYGEGWIFKLRINDPSELDGMLDSDGYSKAIAAES